MDCEFYVLRLEYTILPSYAEYWTKHIQDERFGNRSN